MADYINATAITNNSVTLEYEFDNSSRGSTTYGHIFLAPGNLSYQTIEANAASYLIQTRGIGPYDVLTDDITRTISANTTYSYMYSVTNSSTFNSAQVIYRRPLNPPGTFTSLGPPIFTDATVASPGTVNTYYSDGVTASAATSYSLYSGSLPPGVSLSSNTGAISGTPTTAGTYSFRVSANNSYGTTQTATLSITINPLAPVWTDQTIASPAIKDAAYSDGVAATNQASYRISSGALPTGISLNTSSGAIAGTPTAEGTANFTVQAYNATGTISVGLTLEVISGLAPPSWTDQTLSTDLRRGIAYSDGVSATDAASYTTTGTFVPGLTLNSSTGAVTGTPTEQGTYDFSIVASNAAGSATAAFSLPVKPGAQRWDGSAWQWVETFKRWDGTAWVDVTSTKRWDGSQWVDADL